MKLDTPFLRLPLRFDPERLAVEVGQFAESDWRAHPQGHPGNTAVPLIAANGDPADDGVSGPMRPTPALARCPYLRQVLASLAAPLGRTRLMRIAGRGEATAHVDTNYYWSQRVRVHVPAVTYPGVRFLCGGAEVSMAAGECWLFDTWRLHNVLNPDDRPRVHLVADTVGSAAFWNLVDSAERVPAARPGLDAVKTRHVPFEDGVRPDLETESVNRAPVMSPWEVECQFASLMEDVAGSDAPAESADRLERVLRDFHRAWRGLWAQFGDSGRGLTAYRSALEKLRDRLAPLAGRIRLPNCTDAAEAVLQWVVRPALNFGVDAEPVRPRPPLPDPRPPAAAPTDPAFDRPVIVLAAPRSGSSMLFEALARSPGFYTVGGESHAVLEAIPALRPAARGWESNRLTAADVTPEVAAAVRAGFRAALRDRDGNPPPPGVGLLRLLEKTPKNALRVPFLRAVFPDARFIYLSREPAENIGSILEAWRSGRFVTYPDLPGWHGPPWSLVLIPGWRALHGRPLAEVAAAQWAAAHEQILADLGDVPADRWCSVRYADLVANPQRELERLCIFAGVPWDQTVGNRLPQSRHTVTPPAPGKWRTNAAEVEPVLPSVAGVEERVAATAGSLAAPAAEGSTAPAELRSVHSGGFPDLLSQFGVSLLVTTYQAGKLFVVRADGERLNTHFRSLPVPMGLAADGGRLAVGTRHHVWEFRDQPDAGRSLDPAGRVDACYLPRSAHLTGDVRGHELAYDADGELWLVNTRFSCLCTLDRAHSFVPRWRPPFVSALAAEDRCHLNGLGMRDGRPGYVTCLGRTNAASGWRENKRDGGLILDVPSGEAVAAGLSMPHSPRWHDGRLWVLESGRGALSVVDPSTGRAEPVAELPGFTRGLDFYGPLAFVGLSQVRETSTFGGLPITERPEALQSGVWAVDVRTGRVAGFLRFEGGVREIFAILVLPRTRFPDVVTDDEGILGNSFVLPDSALSNLA